MKVVVAGGTGFLGDALIDAMQRAGHVVDGADAVIELRPPGLFLFRRDRGYCANFWRIAFQAPTGPGDPPNPSNSNWRLSSGLP